MELRAAALRARREVRPAVRNVPRPVRVLKSTYIPNPRQRLLHASTANFLLYGGAAGGGKSRGAVENEFDFCMRHPGCHSYLFRRTYPELEETLIDEAHKAIPKELGRYSGDDHTYRLINGSELRFRHCQHRKDVHRYQSAQMHRLTIDEATHFPGDMVDYLLTRVRVPKELGFLPAVKFYSNPGGIGHAYFKSKFIDPAPGYWQTGGRWTATVFSRVLNKHKVMSYEYIPARVSDNKEHIGEEYIFGLEHLPKDIKDALLNGNWDIFTGKAFPEFANIVERYFDRRWTHVISPFEIPESWTRYRSLDWGYNTPFSVGWWAIDPDGRAYRYREWYGAVKGSFNEGLRLTAEDVARGIARRETDERNKGLNIYGIADPSIFDDNGSGQTIANAMAKHQVYFRAADNKRIPGKMQVHGRLNFDDEGRPMMYIFRTCVDFIKYFQAVICDEMRPEDVDTKCEDHIYDETRYFCMARPIAGWRPEKKIEIPGFDPLEEYEIKRGGFFTL